MRDKLLLVGGGAREERLSAEVNVDTRRRLVIEKDENTLEHPCPPATAGNSNTPLHQMQSCRLTSRIDPLPNARNT